MPMIRAAGAFVCAILAFAAPGRAAQPPGSSCRDMLSAPARDAGGPVGPEDLLDIRDIGFPENPEQERLLSVSPDGRSVAFVEQQADADRNRTCQAVMVMPIAPHARPTILDDPGNLILRPVHLRGYALDYGYPTTNRPLWSPDGRWIAYLKTVNGIVQVWRARADGGATLAVTSGAQPVAFFAWSSDGQAILIATQPAVQAAEDAITREGQSGYLYDARITPVTGGRPHIALPQPYEVQAVDLATGLARAPTLAERAVIQPPKALAASDYFSVEAASPDGWRAWVAPRHPNQYLSASDLWVRPPGRPSVRCPNKACTGLSNPRAIIAAWWKPANHELWFLRREGWADSQEALYRWQPGAAPRRLFVTDDVVGSCEPSSAGLVCTRESSRHPRALVLIDWRRAGSQDLYDPNPQIRPDRLGTVQRLFWTNRYGIPAFGDLVLPQTGTGRYPLIIVQYRSRGFLRGGTGDEYPIQAFAARGYAVLSVDAPASLYRSLHDPSIHSIADAMRRDEASWADEKSKDSSLMTGIAKAVATGRIDPAHIGITGLSDGASIAAYALIHHPSTFDAASLSACCTEGEVYMALGGPALAHERSAMGFPPAWGQGSAAWKEVSLEQNAASIHSPILFEMADHELTVAVETYMALRQFHDPVEMYVYPDEFHLKWQPAHRLAIYRRGLDWFDFWMLSREDPDPAKRAQYARWRAMRAAAVPQLPPTRIGATPRHPPDP